MPDLVCTFNAAYHGGYQVCPYRVIFGRESAPTFTMLAEEGSNGWKVERLDQKGASPCGREQVQAQEQLQQ